jgi:very-short-patch-repair endonuclease
MKRHARAMRHEPTRAENRLWSWLRDRRFDELKFRRQVPVGPYILDFYCAERQLAIEVDGRQHEQPDMIDYDSERSAYLQQQGIYVLRIPNEVLVKDAQMVAEMIRWAIAQSRAFPPAAAGEKVPKADEGVPEATESALGRTGEPLIRPSGTFSPLRRGEGCVIALTCSAPAPACTRPSL